MTPLGRRLPREIAARGRSASRATWPLCLRPAHGYYATRDPFGAAGDFITAPEISQMFGELIGLWCAEAWPRLGRPAPFAAGRARPGPRHADGATPARRAGAAGLPRARRVQLVETSPAAARSARRRRLARRRAALGRTAGRGARRGPADPGRQRVLRRAAGAPVRRAPRRLARAAGRRSTDDGASPSAARRPRRSDRGRCRDAAEARSPSSRRRGRLLAGGSARAIAATAGRRCSIDYGACAEPGFGDTLQAVRAPRLRGSAGRRPAGRPHRPRRFRGAWRAPHGPRRRGPRAGAAGAIPRPPRHRRRGARR